MNNSIKHLTFLLIIGIILLTNVNVNCQNIGIQVQFSLKGGNYAYISVGMELETS